MKLIPIKLNNKGLNSPLQNKKVNMVFPGDEKGGFFVDRGRSWGFLVCFISVATQILLILLSWGKLPNQVPLFYSLPWGNDVLSKPMFLWILPILTVAFALVNFSVIRSNIQNKFVSNVLMMTLCVISFMNAFGIIKIISLLT